MRFPELSGEWIESKLGDIADFSKGAGISKDQRSEEGNPCILYGELYTRYKSEVITNVFSKTALPDSELVKSKSNDIIIPASGETAEDIATARCVPFDNILLGGDLNIIRLHEQDGKFFSYQLNGVRKYDIATVAQGVSVVHLHAGDLKGITVKYPSHIAEQEKISQILGLIDDRIATQSKIIEELKTLRGALVDTYINDGNNNNENQTIMSLGAYGCFVRGLTYSSVDVTDNTATTGVVRSNNLEYGSPVGIKADLVYVTKKPSPEQMLVNGDIVICMANGSSSLVGKASNYQELCRNMTVGAFCGIYRGTHPLTKWIFMSSAYCKAVANAIQGGNGAIANLHAEDILSMCFAVPSDYKTITELGKLLSLFDEKLHAAEEQLARFIEQKKYFLFKMFI